MPIAVFPVAFQGIGLDPKGATVEVENPSQRQKMEGGYSYTRPRYTRAPSSKVALTYVNLHATDVTALQEFWALTRGRAFSFMWTNPFTKQQQRVRFANESLEFTYSGVGDKRRWDANLAFETVYGIEARDALQ